MTLRDLAIALIAGCGSGLIFFWLGVLWASSGI